MDAAQSWSLSMQPPSLEPWIVDRLRAERAFSRKLLRSAKKRPELRTSSPFEDKVTNTDESLEFALNLACDGNPRQVFSEMGYDYDAVSFGRPVQRLSLRTQLLDALLERYPASPTEEEDSQTAARQPTRVPAN